MTYINVFDFLLQACLIIKLTILVLICFSAASWAIVIHLSYTLNSAERDAEVFEDQFWSGIELSRLYQENLIRHDRLNGSEQIFYVGFKEFARMHRDNNQFPNIAIDGAKRAMHVSMKRKIEGIESYIPFLGTAGSVSPYIGLFGTVCSIIHTFISFSIDKQITIQTIAPGIAESLIATAAGLFCAIPAVIAFNRLIMRINKLEQKYECFIEEFTGILHHQAFDNYYASQAIE